MSDVDLGKEWLDPSVVDLVPLVLREKYRVMPVRLAMTAIVVAMVDPTNLVVLDELRFVTQRELHPVAVTDAALTAALNRTGPVRDLKPFVAVASATDAASIRSVVDALIYLTIFAETRFIRVDDPGIWLWKDQWKLEARADAAVRQAVIRQLCEISSMTGNDRVGSLSTLVEGRRRSRFFLGLDELGSSMLIERLDEAEAEQRVEAGRFAPEPPAAHPYR